MRILAVGVVLLLSACASAPLPASLTAMNALQLREQSGLYPGSWQVTGSAHAAQYAALVRWAQHQGIVVTTADLTARNLMGSVQHGYGGWIVLINDQLAVDAQLYALLHELGHLYGHASLNGDDGEVVAEMVAAMACERIGLNVWPQTTAYLADRVPSLDQQMRAVQLHGARIDQVVAMLVKACGA